MKCIIDPPLSIHETGNRPNQEDAIVQWNGQLFLLCDGMGGHENGEVASQTVTRALTAWFQANMHTDEPLTDELLMAAIEAAYLELDVYADDNPKQMGTTLTLLYLHRNGATAAHIGDSRIYHIRPGRGILYQSRDHSLAFDLFQSGEISYDEMMNFRQKNVVTRAMTPGEDSRMRPDVIHITDIQTGDWFYLCSDGMLEHMTSNELFLLLSAKDSDSNKRKQLIDATSDSNDNHSAWMIHVKDVTTEPADKLFVNEEPTARCNAINILPKQQETDDGVMVVQAGKPSLFQRIKNMFNPKASA